MLCYAAVACVSPEKVHRRDRFLWDCCRVFGFRFSSDADPPKYHISSSPMAHLSCVLAYGVLHSEPIPPINAPTPEAWTDHSTPNNKVTWTGASVRPDSVNPNFVIFILLNNLLLPPSFPDSVGNLQPHISQFGRLIPSHSHTAPSSTAPSKSWRGI